MTPTRSIRPRLGESHTACKGRGPSQGEELFKLALASGRLSCIWLDQIIAFGSVIQVPDANLCGAHGRIF